jgi:hypothetical protein
MSFNPLPADVANKRHLGSAPKSRFCDLTGKSEVIGLSDLMTLFIDLGCLHCKQTQRAFNVSKNMLNWLKIDLVDQELFKIQLTRVWELFLRRWTAWHSKRHCIFTAGGERVNENAVSCRNNAWISKTEIVSFLQTHWKATKLSPRNRFYYVLTNKCCFGQGHNQGHLDAVSSRSKWSCSVMCWTSE